jgi:hypothetical protein
MAQVLTDDRGETSSPPMAVVGNRAIAPIHCEVGESIESSNSGSGASRLAALDSGMAVIALDLKGSVAGSRRRL